MARRRQQYLPSTVVVPVSVRLKEKVTECAEMRDITPSQFGTYAIQLHNLSSALGFHPKKTVLLSRTDTNEEENLITFPSLADKSSELLRKELAIRTTNHQLEEIDMNARKSGINRPERARRSLRFACFVISNTPVWEETITFLHEGREVSLPDVLETSSRTYVPQQTPEHIANIRNHGNI